ncbi:hypothetical protein AC812_06625 [Bellilinea caldifistulae]|uniref:Uncharacterized protein n=1 Tax=Bellilinea caldifistulae TaxID=360411 RepID=A0A0P6XT99_9CHLR|nr:hypothetical protein AC812_06625 [Bellilinea caldifistulae]
MEGKNGSQSIVSAMILRVKFAHASQNSIWSGLAAGIVVAAGSQLQPDQSGSCAANRLPRTRMDGNCRADGGIAWSDPLPIPHRYPITAKPDLFAAGRV